MQNKPFFSNLGHKIRIIQNDIDKYFKTSWNSENEGPTRMQCATMHYLRIHENKDVFQKDLENAFSISGATVTNILKVMEKDGMIRRVPMPNDARLKKIELTEKGIALEDAAHAQIIRLEEGIQKGFSEEELTIFRGYLDRLTQNIVDLIEENTK